VKRTTTGVDALPVVSTAVSDAVYLPLPRPAAESGSVPRPGVCSATVPFAAGSWRVQDLAPGGWRLGTSRQRPPLRMPGAGRVTIAVTSAGSETANENDARRRPSRFTGPDEGDAGLADLRRPVDYRRFWWVAFFRLAYGRSLPGGSGTDAVLNVWSALTTATWPASPR
jgi:hypothetical protein